MITPHLVQRPPSEYKQAKRCLSLDVNNIYLLNCIRKMKFRLLFVTYRNQTFWKILHELVGNRFLSRVRIKFTLLEVEMYPVLGNQQEPLEGCLPHHSASPSPHPIRISSHPLSRTPTTDKCEERVERLRGEMARKIVWVPEWFSTRKNVTGSDLSLRSNRMMRLRRVGVKHVYQTRVLATECWRNSACQRLLLSLLSGANP